MGRMAIRILFIISISINLAILGTWLLSGTQEIDLKASLNLTGAQQKQLQQIRLAVHRQNEQVKGKIRECQKNLLASLNEDPIDKLKIHKWVENINMLQKKIQLNSINALLEIRTHLQPHQCTCLMEGLGSEIEKTSKPCDKDCCSPKNE